MDKPISELAQQILERKMAENPDDFRPQGSRREWEAPPEPDRLEMKPFSPGTLGTIGSLMDATGTYLGMKTGIGSEGNPMVNMIAHQNPELTGIAAFGSRPVVGLAGKLIGKLSPKLADALVSNLGAQQASLGSDWLTTLAGGGNFARRENGFEKYSGTMDRWTNERNRRK